MVNELGRTQKRQNVLMIHHRLLRPCLRANAVVFIHTSRPATDRLRFDIEIFCYVFTTSSGGYVPSESRNGGTGFSCGALIR